MAPSGLGIPSWEGQVAVGEPVRFEREITLGCGEVLDLVAACEDMLDQAEQAGQMTIAFGIEGVRRFLLDRLCGGSGRMDE